MASSRLKSHGIRLLWIVASAVCVGVAAAASSLLVRSASDTPPSARLGRTDFTGMHFHSVASLEKYRGPEIDGVRLWDTKTNWANIEPEKGKWAVKRLDQLVYAAHSRGLDVTITLGQTPTWASSQPKTRYEYGYGAGSMPAVDADWAEYVEFIALRYKGRISTYEIWNEPKIPQIVPCTGVVFFCGSATDLVRLTEIAKAKISVIDPKARVASPSFTHGEYGVRMLDQFLKAGGGNFVDIISFHFYFSEPEELSRTVKSLRELLARYRLDHLPIWNTEMGTRVFDSEGPKPKGLPSWDAGEYTVEESLGRYARASLILSAGGVERQYFYAWDSRLMGYDRFKQKAMPIRTAFTTLRSWLAEQPQKCQLVSSSHWKCVLEAAAKSSVRSYVMWSSDGPIEERLGPGKWKIQGLNGQTRNLSIPAQGAGLLLTGSPVKVTYVGRG